MSTNEKPNAGASGQKAPWTVKRIAAVAGIVLLVAMYVVTFVSALIGTPGAGKLFRFSLGMTIAVPIFLWIFIWCVGKLTNRHSMASMDILSSNPEERRKMEEAILREAGSSGDGAGSGSVQQEAKQ